MGRRIEMKKIEDHKKSVVTFSKRRSSLIKKAQQTAVTCDVDVAFLAFSSSGRISTYCNRPRMEDLLYRFVNLPVEKRLSHVKDVQDKMKKLEALGNTRSEDEILRYLNAQTENLEYQIKMKQMELHLAEADLRDFEQNPGQEVSLNQCSWCERNLRRSIEKLKEKKKETLATETARRLLNNGNGNSLLYARSDPPNWQHQMQFESWRNNLLMSLSVPKDIFYEMVGKGIGKEVTDDNGASDTTTLQLGAPIAPGFFFHKSSPKNHPLWKQVLVPGPQDESKSLFVNFTGENSNLLTRDYLSKLSTFHESSSKHVTNTSGGAGNYWGVSFQQNQPTMVLNNVGMETNQKGNDNNMKGNNHTYNEIILSSAPSVQATPPASRAPIRLYDFFPTKVPEGKCTEDSED